MPNEEFSLILLLNGPAVQIFKGDYSALRQRAEALVAKGMQIHVCVNALRTFSIDTKPLWIGCEIVSAGMLELVTLQKNGYAYIKP